MKLTHSGEKHAGSSGQWGSRVGKSGFPSGANTGGNAAQVKQEPHEVKMKTSLLF